MKGQILVLLAIWPHAAEALGSTNPCDDAALQAASDHDVPPQIMLAITRAETGRSEGDALQPWPWAVNQAGTSHWFDTAEDASSFVADAMQEGYSNLDLGCFQLNLHWHGGNFRTVEDMFDPSGNADYAARFLVENHRRTGNWVDAVAAYHSTRPEDAAAYIEKVEAILLDLQGADAVLEPAQRTSPDPERENLFPLLRPGAVGSLASLVPQSDAGQSLILAAP